jgi:hypothetical protein
MGILPARESYAANLASALDCNLIIPALNEGACIGQTMAWSYVAATPATLSARYVGGVGIQGTGAVQSDSGVLNR